MNVPLAEARHDRVDVPEIVRLEELRLHVIPVEGDVDSDRETVPERPFRKATVIVEVPADPVATEAVVGVAVREKSSMVMVTVAVWLVEPTAAVTVTT